jgi:hypothetical protein
MRTQQLRDLIIKELPILMQKDAAFREVVLDISRLHFADKAETDNRFEQLIVRLDRFMDEDRKKWEANEKKWEENERKWEENERKWEENEKKWEENERKWEDFQQEIVALREDFQQQIVALREDFQQQFVALREDFQQQIVALREEFQQQIVALNAENQRKWEEFQQQIVALNAENQRKWEEFQQQIVTLREEFQQQIVALRAENQKKWEAKQEEDRLWREKNERKWEEGQKVTDDLNRKYNQLFGAVGRRWGLHSEASFRNGLAGILKDFQGIEVLNVTEWDDEGVVFGQPDQIELDLIIKNGVLMVCEIKSSVTKSDMYVFNKKVRFYEQKHDRLANRMIVISPMVDENALPYAKKLGIDVYSFADEVEL